VWRSVRGLNFVSKGEGNKNQKEGADKNGDKPNGGTLVAGEHPLFGQSNALGEKKSEDHVKGLAG